MSKKVGAPPYVYSIEGRDYGKPQLFMNRNQFGQVIVFCRTGEEMHIEKSLSLQEMKKLEKWLLRCIKYAERK